MTDIIWDGKGMPPQGTVCEFNANWAHKAGGESWHLVTVAYVSDELYVVRRNDPVPQGLVKELCGPVSQLESNRFRRYRTPEQIAADDRLHSIRNALTAINESVEAYNESLACSAAIRVTVEAMIDAGYRKQVAP